MIDKNEFERCVVYHYNFLVETYGFSFECSYNTERLFIIEYSKGIIVKIIYSYANRFIDIELYNLPPTHQAYNRRKNSIKLLDIIQRYNSSYTFDMYNAIMPHAISINDSIEQTAHLLSSYGDELLSEKLWFSCEDVLGE